MARNPISSNDMKKGFTLIELLVVIAIIAILAAILFPVFAQAKAAAKATVSLSNAKQISLGMLMYSGDADDMLVPAASWNTGNDPLAVNGTPASPWSVLIQAYTKNGELLQDPSENPGPNWNGNQTVSDSFLPEYGYNYVFLSPVIVNSSSVSGYSEAPVSDTSAAQVADTVLLTNKWGYNDSNVATAGFKSFNGVNTPLMQATVEAPICIQTVNLCKASWGINDGYVNSASGDGLTTIVSGADTGGVSLPVANKAVTAWLDGHVTRADPGYLARGTTWSPTATASSVTMVDVTQFLWDLQ